MTSFKVVTFADAFNSYLSGNAEKYQSICLALKDADLLPEKDLLNFLAELKASISLLTNDAKDLVRTLLDIKWDKCSNEIITEILQLFVGLAVGQVTFSEPVLRCLTKKLMPSIQPNDNRSIQEIESQIGSNLQQTYDAIHLAIDSILNIQPMCQTKLLSIIIDTYPFHRRHTIQIRDFARNLMRITEYATDLRVEIFRVIISETLKLDTVCCKAKVELDVAVNGLSSNNLNMDCDSITLSKSKDKLDELAGKLDVLLCDLFSYIEKHRKSKSGITTAYRMLLEVFERVVLPVYNCSHIQYLWLYTCSLHQDLCYHFLNYLWCKLMNPNTVDALRLSSACYLSDFLARSQVTSLQQCTSYLNLWVEWLQNYVKNDDHVLRSENLAKHLLFYVLCQCTFYLIGARHKELIEMKKGHKYLKGLQLDKLVTSPLNPLKFCTESVVSTFASLSRTYQFAFCYGIMERNRRYALYDMVNSSSSGDMQFYERRLHWFFPLEVFHLEKCQTFVGGLLRPLDVIESFISTSARIDIGQRDKSKGAMDGDDYAFLQPEDAMLSRSMEKQCSMLNMCSVVD